MNKILCIIAMLFAVTACGEAAVEVAPTPPQETSPGVVLTPKPAPVVKTVGSDGTWTFTHGSFVSQVIIRNGSVDVTMGTASSNLIYWRGTFPQAQLHEGEKVVSDGDVDYLAHTIGGSSESKMAFRYSKGTLTYDMTVQGVTKTLVAKK